ncbi:DUF2125 domain-containing protein [Paracoccus sp. Z118]|nr:DUF2125 domain-containing protein [Paracoccus sp. Z118]MBV0891963.1 DUF2125 domain-containing protein [Paracoccus sp. Z118]
MYFRMTSSTLALLALTAPAFADVTPSEVWQNWVDYYKATGYSVAEGSREEAGDTLTLGDVVFSMDMPDGDFAFTIPQVVMQATGDGRVRTGLADQSTGTLRTVDEEGRDVNIAFTVQLPGAEVVSSGTPEDMTDEGSIPTLTVTVDEVRTQDQTFADPVRITSADMTYSQRMAKGDLMRAEFDVASGQTDMVLDVSGKDEEGRDFTASGALSMASLQSAGSGSFPVDASMDEDMAAALRAGMDMTADFQAGPMTASFDMNGVGEDGAPVTASMKAEVAGMTSQMGMSGSGVNFQLDSDAADVELTSADMPFPVTYSTEGTSMGLQMPVTQSDEPQPFKVTYSLNGLALGDAIWDLFDQGRVLPRDPANFELDVTGLVRVVQDVFDPAFIEANAAAAEAEADAEDAADTDTTAAAPEAGTADQPSGNTADTPETDTAAAEPESPYEPVEVTINRFAIDAAGASVSATGDLRVPEDSGMDAPVGTISARYEGLNGLIDSLMQLGLVPQDQATAARMMLAMFASPAPDGGDVLTTELEFREGGSIFANGQQVK